MSQQQQQQQGLPEAILDGIKRRWFGVPSIWVDFPNGDHLRIGWSYKGTAYTAVILYDATMRPYKRIDVHNLPGDHAPRLIKELVNFYLTH